MREQSSSGVNMKTKTALSIRFLTRGALIAALYVGLTYLSYAFGLDKGVVQVRFSEALCVLAALTPAAVPGVTIGCFLSGLFTGAHPIDMVVGSLASLLGVLGCRMLKFLAHGKVGAFLVPLPNVLVNALVIPVVLALAYGATEGYFFLFLSVGAGELISAGLLGGVLLCAVRKRMASF